MKQKDLFWLGKASIADLYRPRQESFSTASCLFPTLYIITIILRIAVRKWFLKYYILSKAEAELYLPWNQDLQVKAILGHSFHRGAGKGSIKFEATLKLHF